VVPIFIIGYFFTYSRRYQKLWQQISFAYILLTGGSFIAFMVIAQPPRSYDYYVGVLFCMMFGYTFIRERFIYASIAGLILISAYLIVCVFIIQVPYHTLFYSVFYLFAVNFLGMLIARHLEISARKDFFLEHQLSKEQDTVLRLNTELEQRVAERTLDLEASNKMLKTRVDDLHASEQQRHKLEEQLRQAYKMEAIGTLAGGIAHDFNNILSGIFGYAQLAEMNIHDHEKAKKYLGQIVKGGQRASALVQQILTFSRQAEHQKIPIKVSVILKEALKLLRSSIPTSIEIQQEIVSTARIMADPTQIHQVIMNLCTNAYQAMDDTGGVLAVGLHEIENPDNSPGDMPGKYLVLEISDTGGGIEEKNLKRIFDPYFTTKEVGKGTGLGLSMVDGIVKKHNGRISVESRPGKGTRFQVFWPMVEQTIESPVPEESKQLQTRGTEQILLVDDEIGILDSLEKILSRQGYRVSAFSEAVSALEMFKKQPDQFDLVITDMTMPKMTGDRLSAEILSVRKDMPIILFTGYNDKISKEKALTLGIRKYLQKPATGHELHAAIREILDGPGAEQSLA
jgi:signal transduction histidine kinase/CheY-like chemotaxis protein